MFLLQNHEFTERDNALTVPVIGPLLDNIGVYNCIKLTADDSVFGYHVW